MVKIALGLITAVHQTWVGWVSKNIQTVFNVQKRFDSNKHKCLSLAMVQPERDSRK